jgi:hypothetical protein
MKNKQEKCKDCYLFDCCPFGQTDKDAEPCEEEYLNAEEFLNR